MNDTSGFQEVWSSIFQLPSSRFPHEQWHRFGTGFLHLLRTQEIMAPAKRINTTREKVPGTIFMPTLLT
jgi:hypothetical protein